MKKNKGFFNWKINVAISKLSNIMLFLFIVLYLVIVILGASVTKKAISAVDKANGENYADYIFVPEYEHKFYNNEINTHFAVIAQRTYDSDEKESINYRTIFYNQGRYINGTEPGYRFESFTAKAGLVSDIKNTEINDMYYFTEQKGSTSTSHNYTINNSSGEKNPKYMYFRLIYRSESELREANFYEEIWLTPSKDDIAKFNDIYNSEIKGKNAEYLQYTESSDPEASNNAIGVLNQIKNLNIRNSDDARVGTFQIVATRDEEQKRYSCVVKCNVDNRTNPYHIDLQTWIENENGEYLPFIGAYNFSSDHDYYSSGSYSIYDQTKAKYLCAKVVMYDKEGSATVSYYKQEIGMLFSSFVIGNDGVDCTFKY